jgi:hypothetical protein
MIITLPAAVAGIWRKMLQLGAVINLDYNDVVTVSISRFLCGGHDSLFSSERTGVV